MHPVVTHVAVRTIKESRELRIQPFNEYRKRFNLEPYTSFRQFTGKKGNIVQRPCNMNCSIQSRGFISFALP